MGCQHVVVSANCRRQVVIEHTAIRNASCYTCKDLFEETQFKNQSSDDHDHNNIGHRPQIKKLFKQRPILVSILYETF